MSIIGGACCVDDRRVETKQKGGRLIVPRFLT